MSSDDHNHICVWLGLSKKQDSFNLWLHGPQQLYECISPMYEPNSNMVTHYYYFISLYVELCTIQASSRIQRLKWNTEEKILKSGGKGQAHRACTHRRGRGVGGVSSRRERAPSLSKYYYGNFLHRLCTFLAFSYKKHHKVSQRLRLAVTFRSTISRQVKPHSHKNGWS